MHQQFAETLTGTAFLEVWHQQAPVDAAEQNRAGASLKPQSPVRWDLVIGARPTAPGAAYTGAHVRVTWLFGERQQRIYTLDARPRRWRGHATAVLVEAALVEAGESVTLTGAGGWQCCPSAIWGAAPILGTHLVARKTLSFTQATTDAAIAGVGSLGALQPEARRIMVTADALTGGGAMVPVTVRIFGRRFIGDAWILIGEFVVGTGTASNNVLVDVVPGQLDELGYQVVGFPAAGGGSATLHAWEELDSEGC